MDFDAYKKDNLLPSQSLDPVLVQKVRPLFIRGDYETAVFQAFNEVEVRVRKTARLPAHLISVDLMRRSFDPNNGPLTDTTRVAAEKEATSHLFAGAIGLFKNPASHRNAVLTPEETVELIHLANHLLRMVDTQHTKSP